MSRPLELTAARRRRGAFLLDIPAFSLEPGSVVGLVGPNGAGKSTLMELCAGLLAPDSGTVRVFGVDPARDPVAARRRLALMTDQQPVPALRVDVLLRAVSRFYPTWDAALTARLLERFGLDVTRRADELSKGEGTRLRLVLALAWRPDVVLLDEPGTGLDVRQRRSMLAEVLAVVRDPARTVLFSTHQVDDVERVADRVVILDGGRIAADGPTDAITGEGRTLEEILAGGVA